MVRRIPKVVFLLGAILSATAEDLASKQVATSAPAEIAEPMRALLAPQGLQVLNGDKPLLEIWFRKEIPLKTKPESAAKSLQCLGETTLLGAAKVHENLTDYKDNSVAPGVYTVRFALQPQDGDHLGTAEYPFFLALIPAKADTKEDGITAYRPMVKASGKDTPTGHPIILSLRPASSQSADPAKINEPAPDHKSITLKAAGKSPDGQSVPLLFDLVVKGKGKT